MADVVSNPGDAPTDSRAPANDPLRRDVNSLGAMLGETITALAGQASFRRIETIRQLSQT